MTDAAPVEQYPEYVADLRQRIARALVDATPATHDVSSTADDPWASADEILGVLRVAGLVAITAVDWRAMVAAYATQAFR
jgi:hypothetical protein